MTQLAAHEKTGIALPAGWKLTLQGVQGQVRDLFNSIEHHNIEISRTALAFFMNLGQSSKSSGNRALGQEMTDFFFLAVQATADQIARTITATAVKRLVDYNWDGVERYPDAGSLKPARPQPGPDADGAQPAGHGQRGGSLSGTGTAHRAGTGTAAAAGKAGNRE